MMQYVTQQKVGREYASLCMIEESCTELVGRDWLQRLCFMNTDECTQTHPFNGPFSGTAQVSW